MLSAEAQDQNDPNYHNSLYYTCKVWGYLKYFHPGISDGSINWDEKLLEILSALKEQTGLQYFNANISKMLDMAGHLEEPVIPPAEIPDSLKFNLNNSWIHDSVFSEENQARLDSVMP